jgi:hypothetical protein
MHFSFLEKYIKDNSGTSLVVIEGGVLGVRVVKLDGGHPDGRRLVVRHPVLELVVLQVFKPAQTVHPQMRKC